MSSTDFGVNDALAVKLWSRTLSLQALDATDIKPLIGEDENAVIQLKTETGKGPGDQVTFGLQVQLQGAGFTENELAEGNGESLSIYSDALVINELGHVVGVKSENTIDAQRVPFDLRAARRWGALSVALGDDSADLVTAATALENGFTVVTRNVSDFEPTGVRVLDPFTPRPFGKP